MAIETVPEWMAGLEDEDVAFIKKFLLASGSLKEVAGLYGVTYPTVRLRLDRLIQKIHLSEDTAADPYVALVKRLAVADKLDFDTAKLLIQSYKKRKGRMRNGNHNDAGRSGRSAGVHSAGLRAGGFSGQEGEHMAGTGPAYPRRPVCGGDGAELYSCAGYTLEPGVGRRAGGIPGFGHPGFFAADGVLYLPQRQAPEKAAGKMNVQDL